jgi:putative membrane protein
MKLKRIAWLSGLAGLLLLTALVLHQGWQPMLAAFAHAGWALLWLLPAHLVPLACDTQAWRVLLQQGDRARRAGFLFLLWVAAVREAVNRLLPAAGIGGEVVGIRLVRLRIPDTSVVSATVIVEVLVTVVVQYLFCGLGIVLMARVAAGLSQLWSILAALLVSLPLPAAMYWLLRHGALFERLERWAGKLFGPQDRFALHLDGVRLDAEIHRLLTQPWRMARVLGWQFAGYVLGTFETWIALRLLGYPVSVKAALAIEALTQVTRHVTFIVPAGLGVQEAAVLLFGYMAGVNGDLALSLALVKRMREILFGVPALLSWHWVEARQLRHARAIRDPELSVRDK